jgi:hypothetical protein
MRAFTTTRLLCLLAAALSSVVATINSGTQQQLQPSSPSSEEDSAPCPLSAGTFVQLKTAANRLLYEHRLKESKTCLQMALREYSHPSEQPGALLSALLRLDFILWRSAVPQQEPRLRELFPGSAHLPDEVSKHARILAIHMLLITGLSGPCQRCALDSRAD